MSSLLANQLYAGGTTSVDTALLTGTQLSLRLNSAAATSLSQTTLSIYDEAGATTVKANHVSMNNGVHEITIDNSVPSLYVASETANATFSNTGVDLVSGSSRATLTASGLTFAGNATFALGSEVGAANQVLTSGGSTGALSWQTMTNVYSLFKDDLAASSGTILFSEFSEALTLENKPVISLTAVTGVAGTDCVPISINTIDLTTMSFTWSASTTITSLCAMLISRG
jgi:hypothetical protein